MNALVAFTSWGCEDRLSGPAFADLSAVIGWLRERDARLAAGAQLSCGAAAGGIHAVADIPRGAAVASIPLSLLITQATAHAEVELRGVRGGTNLMALFLLRHNRSGTAFHAYVAQLPQQLDQTHRWSDEELSMLQASDLVAHSRSRRRAVERHHEALPSSVRPSSPDALGWGLGQVWARSHTVDVGSGPEGALAPLLDMFNHALRPNVRPAAVEGSRYVLRASRAVARGEELSVPYGGGGPLSNARLLFDYGFCLPDNRADDVALPLACDGHHAAEPPPPDAPPPPSASRVQLQQLQQRSLLHALRLDGAGATGRLPRLPRRSRPSTRGGGEGGAAAADGAKGGAAAGAAEGERGELPPRQALLFGLVCTLAEAELAAAAASLGQEAPTGGGPRPALPAWLGWSDAQLAAHVPSVRFLRAALVRRESEYASPLEADEAAAAAAAEAAAEARQRRLGTGRAGQPGCTEEASRDRGGPGCGEPPEAHAGLLSTELPPREACALEVRLGEKRILRGWREWAEARLSGPEEASHDEL